MWRSFEDEKNALHVTRFYFVRKKKIQLENGEKEILFAELMDFLSLNVQTFVRDVNG